MKNPVQYDITPTPRLLERLGELPIDQFQCIGELIDNPADKFLELIREGQQFERCRIHITLPTVDHADACITVQDNGPGMSSEELEHAVRAGYSSNHANDHLGMFGVGFNTATSRLGLVTEVYTTRAGDDHWIGIRIGFPDLIRQNSFIAPGLTRLKADPAQHGTEIRIKSLRLVNRAYFSKPSNIQSVRTELARIYAPLLLDERNWFELVVNRVEIKPMRHCTWDESHFVSVDRLGDVHAVERFDIPLSPRQYCPECLLTFDGDERCPQCGQNHDIRQLQRRLYGWVGIQRFIHAEKYGIDFVRNGRVIESQNKDLFMWRDGDRSEQEYPVDDQRNRGRIVGVVHLDHGAVTFTKNRFERSDPAWAEMVTLVRGDGPLRPQIARKLGYSPSQAPLYRLFQAFRRNEPKPPTPWSQVLAVKDYKLAANMADRFYLGDPDYQSDEKWYELVERQDREIEAAASARGNPDAPPPPFLERDAKAARHDRDTNRVRLEMVSTDLLTATTRRVMLPELSGKYRHRLVDMTLSVNAYSVTADDPDLPSGAPWALNTSVMAPGDHLYLVNLEHPVFRSMTMTALDGLLTELAVKSYRFLEQRQKHPVTFARVLTDFRQDYAGENALEYAALVSDARDTFLGIANSIAGKLEPEDLVALFNELDQSERDTIRQCAAAIGLTDTGDFLENGQFLGYADHETVRFFVGRHPELFFDGKYWLRAYEGLNLGSEKVNNAARQALSEQFDGYLADAIWLASKSPTDLARQDRNAVMRAALSLRLLKPN